MTEWRQDPGSNSQYKPLQIAGLLNILTRTHHLHPASGQSFPCWPDRSGPTLWTCKTQTKKNTASSITWLTGRQAEDTPQDLGMTTGPHAVPLTHHWRLHSTHSLPRGFWAWSCPACLFWTHWRGLSLRWWPCVWQWCHKHGHEPNQRRWSSPSHLCWQPLQSKNKMTSVPGALSAKLMSLKEGWHVTLHGRFSYLYNGSHGAQHRDINHSRLSSGVSMTIYPSYSYCSEPSPRFYSTSYWALWLSVESLQLWQAAQQGCTGCRVIN